jgi:hypothetical protein
VAKGANDERRSVRNSDRRHAAPLPRPKGPRDGGRAVSRRSRTRPTKTAVSKLVLVTFPELNQAFDVGERLTLPLPVSFDPVKGVDLIFQLPWRKLSRGCIFFDNAHTTQCFEKIWLLTYSRHQIAVN